MTLCNLQPTDAARTRELVCAVFTASEGKPEGDLIGSVAEELTRDIDHHNIFGFASTEDDSLLGAIIFSRLSYKHDIKVFLLAPVAVSNSHQGKGIGQALITYGLHEMKNHGAEIAITYGDPSFYSKVGFLPLSQQSIKPPYELSQPVGWIGQSLSGKEMPVLTDTPSCVRTFRNPSLW